MEQLWDDDLGVYVAMNVSAGPVTNRVFLMALPLWGKMATASQAQRALEGVLRSDMASVYGVRSTSESDPRCA